MPDPRCTHGSGCPVTACGRALCTEIAPARDAQGKIDIAGTMQIIIGVMKAGSASIPSSGSGSTAAGGQEDAEGSLSTGLQQRRSGLGRQPGCFPGDDAAGKVRLVRIALVLGGERGRHRTAGRSGRQTPPACLVDREWRPDRSRRAARSPRQDSFPPPSRSARARRLAEHPAFGNPARHLLRRQILHLVSARYFVGHNAAPVSQREVLAESNLAPVFDRRPGSRPRHALSESGSTRWRRRRCGRAR